MPVEHASRDLVARGPGVPIRMRAALMRLPQVSVLRLHVRVHRLAHHQIALLAEVSVLGAVVAELGVDEAGAHILKELEEGEVLHHSHLDDLRDTMAQPARVQSAEERAVRERQHGWVVGAVQVLVPEAVAASARAGASVDARDDGGAEHDVRSVAVIQRSGEPAHVGDDTSAHDQHWLVSAHALGLERLEDALDGLHPLVSLHAAEHQLRESDVVPGEVLTQAAPMQGVNVRVDNGHAASKRRVHLPESRVLEVEHTTEDLDGRCERGRHHALDERGILGRHHVSVAAAVGAGRVHRVGICRLELILALQVLVQLLLAAHHPHHRARLVRRRQRSLGLARELRHFRPKCRCGGGDAVQKRRLRKHVPVLQFLQQAQEHQVVREPALQLAGEHTDARDVQEQRLHDRQAQEGLQSRSPVRTVLRRLGRHRLHHVAAHVFQPARRGCGGLVVLDLASAATGTTKVGRLVRDDAHAIADRKQHLVEFLVVADPQVELSDAFPIGTALGLRVEL
mmetsp:Transcript_18586/g.49936  ORF Transcript_18586/g.49936 Transcript_18586/m.49936 type:complete len:511 (-) Transcript_18586:411-1943(-)